MKDRWSQLSLRDKSDLMSLYIQNGVTSLDKMKEHYNSYAGGGNLNEPPFVKRYSEGQERAISTPEGNATHKLSYAEADGKYIVYPNVQPVDYNNPNSPLNDYEDNNWTAYDRAVRYNDTLQFNTAKEAEYYTKNYKRVPFTGAMLNNSPKVALDFSKGRYYDKGGSLNKTDEPLVNKNYEKSATRMGKLQSYINDWNRFNYEEPSTAEELRTANGGLAQATYLLPREQQDSLFKKAGYILNTGDYGLVRKAVGDRNIPVYQTVEDDILRNNLLHIGNRVGEDGNGTYFHHPLIHAGSFPIAYYVNPKTGEPYAKAWDLNDYGNTSSNKDKNLSLRLQNAGSKVLDMIGNPVVVTTGYQKLPDIPEELAEMMYKKHNLVPTESVFYDNELGTNYPLWSLPAVDIEVEKSR